MAIRDVGIRINEIPHFDIRKKKIRDFNIPVKDIPDFAIRGIEFEILDCNRKIGTFSHIRTHIWIIFAAVSQSTPRVKFIP